MKLTIVLLLALAAVVFARNLKEKKHEEIDTESSEESESAFEPESEVESESESAEGPLAYAQATGAPPAATGNNPQTGANSANTPTNTNTNGQTVETQQPDNSGNTVASGATQGQGNNVGPTSSPQVTQKRATGLPTAGQYNGPTPTIPMAMAQGSGCFTTYTQASKATNRALVDAHVSLKNCLTGKCDMSKCSKHHCTNKTKTSNIKCWHKWFNCVSQACAANL